MKSVFERLGRSIHRHAKLWIGAIVLVTVFLTFGLPQIQMKMGNDVFVSPHRAIYRNSQVYQKHFGGDSLYLMLNGPQKKILSHRTFKAVARFNRRVSHVKNVTDTTSGINLVNSELSHQRPGKARLGGVSQAKLQRDLAASLSRSQKLRLQKRVQSALQPGQKAQVQQFTMTLLNLGQKRRLQKIQQSAMKKSGTPQAAAAAAQSPSGQQKQQAVVQKTLTRAQKSRLQAYTLTLLRPAQKRALAGQMARNLPKVQNMSTGLLHDIFLNPNGSIRKPLRQFFPRNGRHALVILNTSSKSSDMSVDVQLSRDVKHAIGATHFRSVQPKLAGQPHILGQVQGAVIKNMGIMLIFAVILMVLILALIFPVRRRILPLLFVLVCLDWTFGIMGWVNLPLTLATMATLPIIIGLGTDFGVQFLNRYEEEFRKDHDSRRSILVSITNMGTSVGIALIVMALSFLTMFLSKAPLMQKFGLTLAIGVICSYFVEMILIFSTLSLRDAKWTASQKVQKTAGQQTRLSKLLARYAGFVMKHAWPVLIAGLVLGAIGFSTEHRIGVDTQLVRMIPQRMASLRNTKSLQRKIGSTTYVTYLVKGRHLTDPQRMMYLDRLGQRMNREHRDVQGVTSLATVYRQNHGSFSASRSRINRSVNQLPISVRRTLINRSHSAAALQFKVNQHLTSRSQLNLMNQISREIGGHRDGVTIRPAGTQDMMLQGIKNMTANRDLIVIAGLLIIFIVLLLVYRNWRLAIFPVVPIMIVLGLSPLTLFLLRTSYNPLTVALSSLVLGIGIEFTILIMERYREEIRKGSHTRLAITRAIGSVGQAITASGLTVIGGFVAIMFSSFPVLKSFGMITVLDTAYSLISALTILPAFIYILRKRRKN